MDGVGPYQDIGFDRDGDVDPEQRHRLLDMEVTDLVMFAHGRNQSPKAAYELYAAFFAAFPGLVGRGVRPGYAGVGWPSMTFPDEPPVRLLPPPGGPVGGGLDAGTRRALLTLFPGHEETVARLAELLAVRPDSAAAVGEFGRLARRIARAPAGGLESRCFTDDLPGDEQGPPAVLFEDPLSLCRRFAGALEAVGTAEPPAPAWSEGWEASEGSRGPGPYSPEPYGGPNPYGGADPYGGPDPYGGSPRIWLGARELLRQTTYYALKRRAGAVGELGLGPLLGQLARSRPALRVHLVGHGQGARLVAFALRGLPDEVRTVKSVTLLQGAFSQYAFASRLPHAPGRSGALRTMEQRVDGPVVACHSRYDGALGALYPVASAPAHDDRSPGPDAVGDRRWWAVGHGGIHGVASAVRLSLDEALTGALPRKGCVSVDVSSVVRRGAPPSGAHGDICHEELARLIVAAGDLGD
ncbi:serine-threonine protein kinase [Streptomyces sp. NPDC058953]|uniref:serine-threonine protein kinase n=1 Tax=unclassified Streptomyces TaxID=2593676 RepID=UPI0036CECE07